MENCLVSDSGHAGWTFNTHPDRYIYPIGSACITLARDLSSEWVLALSHKLCSKMVDVHADVSIEFHSRVPSAHRVIVFARNGSKVPSRKANPFVIWRVLHCLGTAKFVYPAEFGVGISWTDPRHRGLPQQAGPFAAKPGSIWAIVQGSENKRVPNFCQSKCMHALV